jgi:flavin reductase (DIM6/NTAB) family NADH-FMN oxidoreductase RutF
MAAGIFPPLDLEIKKRALRTFTYGLYVLGTQHGGDVDLATVNWVSQVSFDPPLVTVSVENDSRSIELLRASDFFALSVLADDQREEAAALGKRWKLRPEKVDAAAHRPGVTGCPVLRDAISAIECRVNASLPAGDSTIFVGEVVAAQYVREETPLTMVAAGFRHAG